MTFKIFLALLSILLLDGSEVTAMRTAITPQASTFSHDTNSPTETEQ